MTNKSEEKRKARLAEKKALDIQTEQLQPKNIERPTVSSFGAR